MRAGGQGALIAAEPHGRALVDDLLLLLHHVDDGVRGIRVELGAVRPLQLEHVAGKFDDRDLQSEAEAVIGNLVLPGEARGGDLALRAAVAEAAGHQNAIELLQHRQAAFFLQILGIDAHDVHAAIIGDAGVGHGLVHGFVGVLQLDVLAHDPDGDLVRGIEDAADHLFPDVLRRRRILELEQVDHQLVQPLLQQGERQFVDGVRHIAALDHGLHRHVAEHRELVAQAEVERMVRAADEDVGLDADLAELGHGLLRGLGLQFAGGVEIRHQRDVDEDHVLRSDLEGELPHRLQERQALDVTGRAADLGDEDVRILAAGIDALLDFVGHVRDHLHGLAQVVAATFLLDHRLVNLP